MDCPRCETTVSSGFGLTIHWRHAGHDGDVPDDIDTSRSDDTKQKLSDSVNNEGKNNPFYNKSHTQETRKQISESVSGEDHPMHGETRTESFKQLLSDAQRGSRNPNWRGGMSEPYPREFKEIREFVIKRDFERCVKCGIRRDEITQDLDVHHIDGDRQNNKAQNLVTLCRSCHMEVEHAVSAL